MALRVLTRKHSESDFTAISCSTLAEVRSVIRDTLLNKQNFAQCIVEDDSRTIPIERWMFIPLT